MHRTLSIDYVICTNGHMRMELDTGEIIDLYPGDHVVQRATMHKWSNPSDTEPARIIAVVLPAETFEIGKTGKKAVEEHIAGSESKEWDVSQMPK
jgi:mannose-6-phosphate isomerase-like protein (cupin superfamily)